ncbi:hypothetical protein [Candidatus Nitronereus thalassa]|uniref:Uncharacterized protein n=1 Tax=Candidatus Nitronereus thalassa TaxID=3020898 RepID=A0ABU3K5V8_9BACT|nr:hypothetical protein [Candidatus Nitronereus thalassa]MDT7041794.1 hypothetical protein [Candidatus Nitronereus thalassa]
MREQRWESHNSLSFDEVLATLTRLEQHGLRPVDPEKEGICYVEEWQVNSPDRIQELDPWPIEDVTMIHMVDNWQGDFFLFAGGYHTIFQQYQSVSTYCSISHPWHLPGHLVTILPQAMFWVGFRHTHSFIRIRLHTSEVIAPGDTWIQHQPAIWIDERQQAFQSAIDLLELPIEIESKNNRITLRSTQEEVPFFCSWADAFGPCQFEFNSSDPFAFLVPASSLASTHQLPTAKIRTYLTGFTQKALHDFQELAPASRFAYRCSGHICLTELPDILEIVGESGRLYTTICEFHTQSILPGHKDAAAVVGIMTTGNQYQLEVRFNLMPLPKPDMDAWLEEVLGTPMTYAPLPVFP